jgi:hypothetical protein
MAITPTLITYLQGLTPITTLPDVLSLDDDLWQVMNTLWQRSIAHLSGGIVVEWGGLLELWGDRLRLANLTSGTAEGLQLIVPSGSRFVGSYHTHPHSAGYIGIGFSGTDFADAVNQGERISIVQSGYHIFVMLPTEKTPAGLKVKEWRNRMNTLFQKAYLERENILVASLVANKMICQELNITLYYGRIFSQLAEVYRP